MHNGNAHSSSLSDFVQACPTPAVLFDRTSSGGLVKLASNQQYDRQGYSTALKNALAEDGVAPALETGPQRWIVTRLPTDEILCIGRESASLADERKAEEEECILSRWRDHRVPGLSSEVAEAHLQYIREVDWASTSLGRISDWSETIISYVGHALAAPYPICLGFGKELVREC
jgi:hypothetical protein